MENATDRFSDAEVNSYIYQSWCALYDYLTSKGQDYYLSTQPVYNTALNTDTYALPLDYYKVRGVDVTIGGFARSLSQWRFEERERYNYYGTWNTGLPIAYHIMNGSIVFKPLPAGAYPITLYYYPTAPQLVGDGDAINGVDGFEEWVVLDAAIKMLTKDDRDTSALVGERDRVLARVGTMMSSQDAGEPYRIVRRKYMNYGPLSWKWRS